MKKTLLTVAVVTALSLSANAQSSDKSGFYVTGKVGTSITQMSSQRFGFTSFDDPTENSSDSIGNKNKSTFSGGIAIGYNFFPNNGLPIRADLDLTIRGKAKSNALLDHEDGVTYSEYLYAGNEVKLTTLMANVYYDFYNDSDFTPYVSAGIGYGKVKHTTKTSLEEVNHTNGARSTEYWSMSKNANKFAWSLGVGVQYALNNDVSLDLGYKFIDAGTVKSSRSDEFGTDSSRVKVRSHDISLGFTYNF